MRPCCQHTGLGQTTQDLSLPWSMPCLHKILLAGFHACPGWFTFLLEGANLEDLHGGARGIKGSGVLTQMQTLNLTLTWQMPGAFLIRGGLSMSLGAPTGWIQGEAAHTRQN